MATTWERIAEDICERILSGETPVGSKIPSQQQLATRHGTSVTSSKRAIQYLTQAGVLEGKQGVGVFVVRVPNDADLGKGPSLDERVAALEDQMGEMRARLADFDARDALSNRGLSNRGQRGHSDTG